MPRGGSRIGSGRKGGRRDNVIPMPCAGPSSAEVIAAKDAEMRARLVVPPADLREPERAAWVRLAPLAIDAGLLTDATVPGFEHLCELSVMYTELRAVIDREGWQVKVPQFNRKGEHVGNVVRRHVLWQQLQAIQARFEHVMRLYGLNAAGRPLPRKVVHVAPPSPWAKFDPSPPS